MRSLYTRQLVDFGLSESSKPGRLNSGHDKIDLVNGTGVYLGIVRLGNKNLMFTKTTRSGGHEHDGEIKINEVDFDLYADGDVVVYYNKYKSEGIRDLEKAFNNPTIINMIDDEYTISRILEKFLILLNIFIQKVLILKKQLKKDLIMKDKVK